MYFVLFYLIFVIITFCKYMCVLILFNKNVILATYFFAIGMRYSKCSNDT